VFSEEDKVKRRLSRDELHAQVSRFPQALIAAGVGKGDRVAAYPRAQAPITRVGSGVQPGSQAGADVRFSPFSRSLS